MKKFFTPKCILIISWAAVVIWMGVIFFMSAQAKDESAQLSSGISKILLTVIQKIFPDAVIDVVTFRFIVRKIAHFTCYFILAVLSLNALRRSGAVGAKSLLIALAICVIYAATDEYHQTFVEGRVGNVVDVLIDSAGAITGLGLYQFTAWIFGRRKSGQA